MAVVLANVAADPVALFNYFHSFNLEQSDKARTSTGVRVTLAPNEFVDFGGNFQFSPFSDVLPIGGTLTSIKVMKNGILQYSITSLNLDVLTVYSFTSPTPGAGQEIRLAPIAFAGNDVATGSNFVDKLEGHNGNDRISGRDGNDTLSGMNGNDTLLGDAGNDTALGGAGNDLVRGGVGNDRLDGGTDTDVLFGDAGSDTITGGAGNDTLRGGLDNDVLNGGTEADLLFGDAGNDTMLGGAGNDTLDGGLGDDVLSGDADADIVLGGAGNDTVQGGLGDDTLNGGLGNDRLIGGAGNDKFVFSTAIPAKGANTVNVDRIADFNVGNDTIQIDNAIFKGLIAGALTAAAFRVGTQALDPTDRIIYNRATGDLYFDVNGSVGPSTDQVKFAHLDKVAGAALFPAVALADFFVI